MEKNDFTILKKYHDRWVAIEQDDESKVVGVGNTIEEALEQAKEKGIRNPFVTRVPSDYGTYIL